MSRILVIDDDLAIRRMLRLSLEQENYEVITAENGKQGLAIFQQTPSDVVIIDMIMPEKDGMHTIMDLTRDYPNVKIIAISGGGTIEAERYLYLAEDLGAHRIFFKPINLKDLANSVRELLEH